MAHSTSGQGQCVLSAFTSVRIRYGLLLHVGTEASTFEYFVQNILTHVYKLMHDLDESIKVKYGTLKSTVQLPVL